MSSQRPPPTTVSLFTREWIEISTGDAFDKRLRSPSLRGSGLKSPHQTQWKRFLKSPSLRGSGLKLRKEVIADVGKRSPSLRGSGLKSDSFSRRTVSVWQVSLFTREWIEISVNASTFTMTDGLPLYEGVD